jgi:hypothetical protein
MSFQPDFNVSIVDKCGTMLLTDVSGFGADGWYDGSTGLDNDAVTGAFISFKESPTGAVVTSPIDVTSAVTGATALCPEFELTGASGTYPDGLYTIEYEVNANGQKYTATSEIWGYCNAEYGRDKMFAKYSQMLEDDAKDEYLEDAYFVDRTIRSMKSAISSVNINSLEWQQKMIERILEFYDVPKAY